MGYIDRLNTFTYGTTLLAAVGGSTGAGTYVLGDVIDLRETTNRVGVGKPVYLVVECTDQIITGGSAGTIQFSAVTDSLSTLGAATVASCTLIAQSLAIVTDDTAALAVGIEAGTATYLPNIAPDDAQTGITDPDKVVNRPCILCVPLPQTNLERYLGVLCTIATTTVTAGSVNAYLTTDPPQNWRALPDGI